MVLWVPLLSNDIGLALFPLFFASLPWSCCLRILDVKLGLDADIKFQLGQPFRPYQQLMGVLPDRSKTIVPTPYHDLMTNPNSPIIDFYPRDFELDMNGKKMEWEAVVRIPFIDESRLLPAMKTKEHLLSQAEKDRNEFGVPLRFAYSPDIEFTYPTSLVGIFPDIPVCHCVENIFDLPTMEGLDYHVGLTRDVKLGKSALAGFPSLKTLPLVGNLGFHGVNVFQQDSRNESMVVTLLEPELRAKVEAAKSLLSCKVHVGYPFLSEAKVIRVSDELFNYIMPESGAGQPIAVPHSPQEIDMWHKKAERIESIYSKRLGIMIGEVQSLVHVDTLKGLKKTDDGATVKEFARIEGLETDYASQTVVKEVASEDPRFLEKAALSIEEEFPIGSRAFFLGDFNYGRPLQVVGHTANKADLWVSTVAAKVPEFGRQIVKDTERQSRYTPSFAVAKTLGLNPLVLSKITSSFQVVLDDKRINLGLNLKFEAKKLKVLGYSRKTSGWEFSEKAIQLIQQYMIKFPEFIAGIQRNSQGNVYEATDFYPQSEVKDRIKAIEAWLKETESKKFEKVPLDAEQLDSEVVTKIEQAADKAFQIDPPGKGVNKKINGAPRNALLKPSDAEQRLSHQRFSLGDRVVYVQDSGRVPIATRGTVVGKTRTSRTVLLDVVFDVTFMSGTSLEDRCSPFRGSTVPVHTALNLTDRQVVAESRAVDQNRPQAKTQQLSVNGYGAPLGPNGRGQLIPAQVPGPLQGSFRGAVAGQSNGIRGGATRSRGSSGYPDGHSGQQQGLPLRNQPPVQNIGSRGRGGQPTRLSRGRGGLHPQPVNRNGHARLDELEADNSMVQTSSTFQPRSYANTPPPANLDSRGGSRGGRGMVRGSPHRGVFPGGRGPPRGRATVIVQQQ